MTAPRTEAEALRDEAWQRSARPEIKRLMDSVLATVSFLDLAAQAPRRVDLEPALASIEFSLKQIRQTGASA